MLVMVHRWHRSVAAKGRWGILTKCGVTECVTDHRSHDSLSYWFAMKISEVVPVPKSKSSSVLERRPSTDRCACDDPSYLPSRVMKRAAEENCTSMGRWNPLRPIVTTTIHHEVRSPSRVLTDFQQIESLFN